MILLAVLNLFMGIGIGMVIAGWYLESVRTDPTSPPFETQHDRPLVH